MQTNGRITASRLRFPIILARNSSLGGGDAMSFLLCGKQEDERLRGLSVEQLRRLVYPDDPDDAPGVPVSERQG